MDYYCAKHRCTTKNATFCDLCDDETPTGMIAALTAPKAKVLQLVKGEPTSPLPEDTAQELRKLADAVDRGEISAMVIGIEWADEFETRLLSSLMQTSVLVQLLQMRWADMMRAD